MGNWGTGIKDNDTSFDVYESFFEQYNEGLEPTEIKKLILTQFEYSITDFEDINNVLIPLALSLWEICALDDDLYQKVKSIIENENDLKVWRGLDGSEEDIAKRAKVLNALLNKISVPKEKAKARKKPPVKLDTIYQSGTCLSFQYPNGDYGGAVIIKSEFYKNSGSMSLALTNIRMSNTPSFNDFENAKLLEFSWETVYGQAERCAAKIDKNGIKMTGRIFTHDHGYESFKIRDSYFLHCKDIFNVIGQFPIFTQILLGTSWINENIIEVLDSNFVEGDKMSIDTLANLSPLLSTVKLL